MVKLWLKVGVITVIQRINLIKYIWWQWCIIHMPCHIWQDFRIKHQKLTDQCFVWWKNNVLSWDGLRYVQIEGLKIRCTWLKCVWTGSIADFKQSSVPMNKVKVKMKRRGTTLKGGSEFNFCIYYCSKEEVWWMDVM